MKLLFVHDFPAEYSNQSKKYYSAGFPYSLWQRYLEVFDELIIASRYKEIQDVSGKNVSSGNNVSFHPIKSYKSATSLTKYRSKIYKEMSEAIDSSDLVLVRVPSILGFIAADICKKKQKKYMVEIVGAPLQAYWYYGSLSGKLLSLPMELQQKKAVKNAEVAIYVTNRYLQSKYPTKGIAYNGITDVEQIPLKQKKHDTYNKEKTFKVGLIGSTFTKYKGHAEALKALKQLKEKGYNVRLELVGQGLSDYVKKIIIKYQLESDVKYLGVIYDRALLNRWFEELDLYLQPSKTEGLCRSLIESVSLGVVTLASNVGGNNEIVDETYLFRPTDNKKIVALIEKAIKDNSYKEENVKKNQHKIKELELGKITDKRKGAFKKFSEIGEE